MRTRRISPGFFTNGELCALSPLARLAFIGLWCAADREGRLEDRPRNLKIRLLPADRCDFDKLLAALATAGLIVRYEAEGTKYICVPKFKDHQRPHDREEASKIPAPGADMLSCDEQDVQTLAGEPQVRPGGHPDATQGSPGDGQGALDLDLDPDLEEEGCSSDEKGGPPYAQIVAHLNRRTGAHYRSDSRATRRLIHARWSEGNTIDDFIAVINGRCLAWADDPKMSEYLRPQTLFSPKFEGYLNSCRKAPPTNCDRYPTVTAGEEVI